MSLESIIKINEIFCSIQGESTFSGLPCVFVRTTGCPLRCRWCDTLDAKHAGEDRTVASIRDQALSYKVPLVNVTGGEPLAQQQIEPLIGALCDAGLRVLLETNGHMDIAAVDPRVHVIMDIKCPSSGMTDQMRWENLEFLRSKDEVKLVLADREDYEFARRAIIQHELANRCTVLLSTVWGMVPSDKVVQWMLEDRLEARFQLQLHKFIWGPEVRGV